MAGTILPISSYLYKDPYNIPQYLLQVSPNLIDHYPFSWIVQAARPPSRIASMLTHPSSFLRIWLQISRSDHYEDNEKGAKPNLDV